MKTVTFCYWRIPTLTAPGKTHVTRWKMCAEQARAYPGAIEAHGHEQREVPETPAEQASRMRSMHAAPGPQWWHHSAPVKAGPGLSES